MLMKIIRLEPHSMAIFFMVDVDPGFAVTLCSDVTLFDAVHNSMFCKPADADSRAEVTDVVEQLRENGDVSFEDGWISLRIGMAAVTAYLLERAVDAVQNESFADRQRFEELKRREAAEGRYALLQQALVDALGDKVLEVVAKADAA